ncbi:hypothetical protein JCM17478_26880 [Thermopirellula anaerolimosa]
MRAFAREVEVSDEADFDAPAGSIRSKQSDRADLAGFEDPSRDAEDSVDNEFAKCDRRRATIRKQGTDPPSSRKRSYRHGTGVLRRKHDVPGSCPREPSLART